MIASPGSSPATLYRPRARFFGTLPGSYEALNRELLRGAPLPPEVPHGDSPAWHAAASTQGLDAAVKVIPLPEPIPAAVSASAIRGMERLRDAGALTALRGARATDLPRPEAGRIAGDVRKYAPGVVELVSRVEECLAGSKLFVRSIKLDSARASTTAPSSDPAASNLHFDAEKSSLADYSDPVFQFYLNAGELERQFRILPVVREDLFAGFSTAERQSLPFEILLDRYLAANPRILETIPIVSGALAVFDGRRFAHDAGKGDVEALAAGRFEPSPEADLVIALDTVETRYHQGSYRPELPFFEDSGVPESS